MSFGWNRNRCEVIPAVSADVVAKSSGALSRAITLGGAQLPREEVTRAQAVLSRVAQRNQVGAGHTVVALAGATGSGKSSLFNLLVGEPVSRIGARRPTTSKTSAALWGSDPAVELLDWLEVMNRHHVHHAMPDFAALEGLVLLDLPDFDSRVAAHRAEADRVLERSDVFVWVTDPQKYADALLHEEYVSKVAQTGAKAIVVLNQVDRLSPEAAERCAADLERLLEADGLHDAKVIMSSTITAGGGDALREAIAAVVQEHNAAQMRLLGDVRLQARQLSSHVGAPRDHANVGSNAELVSALEDAAGTRVVLDAVERDYRAESVRRTGWPFTRWSQNFRPKPLARLGLEEKATSELSPGDVRAAVGRSALPPATPAAKAGVELATRRVATDAADGLPAPWQEEIYHQINAGEGDDRLHDALDQAILNVPLRGRFPAWWSVVSVLQWILAAVAIVGAAWLLVLFLLGFVQITPATPKIGGWLPWPLALLVSGLLLGFLLAVASRAISGAGAARARERVRHDMREAISQVANERITQPVTAVLERHNETSRALAEAAN